MSETNYLNPSKRLLSIDILRLIAALLVVYLHADSPFSYILLAPSRVAVPLFFAVSGFFFFSTTSNLMKQRAKKAIKKLSTYYILSLIFFCLVGFYECQASQDFSPFKMNITKIFNLIVRCSSPIMPYGFHLWFLVALIEVYVIFLLFPKYKPQRSVFFLYILLFLYFFVMVVVKEYIPVLFNTRALGIIFSNVICFALPFFYLGYYIAEKKDKLILIKDNALIIGLFTAIIFLQLEYQIIGDKTGFFSLVPIVFFILIYALKHNSTSKVSLLLAKCGKDYSLLIYILHPILITFLRNKVSVTILFLVTFLATLIMSILLKGSWNIVKRFIVWNKM